MDMLLTTIRVLAFAEGTSNIPEVISFSDNWCRAGIYIKDRPRSKVLKSTLDSLTAIIGIYTKDWVKS